MSYYSDSVMKVVFTFPVLEIMASKLVETMDKTEIVIRKPQLAKMLTQGGTNALNSTKYTLIKYFRDS